MHDLSDRPRVDLGAHKLDRRRIARLRITEIGGDGGLRRSRRRRHRSASGRRMRFRDGVTVLLDQSGAGEAGAVHAALDWCARRGHAAVVVARLWTRRLDADARLEREAWAALLPEGRLPIVVATTPRAPRPMIRLDASVWSLVPLRRQHQTCCLPLSQSWSSEVDGSIQSRSSMLTPPATVGAR